MCACVCVYSKSFFFVQLSLRLDKLRHSVSTDPTIVTYLGTLRADAQDNGQRVRRETAALTHELETLINASEFAANEAYAHVRYGENVFCIECVLYRMCSV